ncbi:hypothetical protein LTR53_012331 [Teratosphaeriaceae sp. CCFEE 6253]|nr:hypothetical protein LTR53_012331 [Teratosphaeriaceae sp. CCFEE 6253]
MKVPMTRYPDSPPFVARPSTASFDTIPSQATCDPQPFAAHASDDDLESLQQLLEDSRIEPDTCEISVANVKNITRREICRRWLEDTKKHWEAGHAWRKTEDRINSFPNFTAPVEDDGFNFQVHFVALFSNKPEAVPLLLVHGWPGSFLEFLGTLDVLRERYTPANLPFHVIVPSLPGCGYSTRPPLDKDSGIEGVAGVMDKLMLGLGFGGGYIAQGGDMGSLVARVLGVTSEACKAVHLHFAIDALRLKDVPADSLDQDEQIGPGRCKESNTLGEAHAREHGTRSPTRGLVPPPNPIALLAWVGEKFLQWSDESPPLDDILDVVTLCWLTKAFPRPAYPYQRFSSPMPAVIHLDPKWHIDKPMGYSWHFKDIPPVPKVVAKTANLVWYRAHTHGAQLTAMEKPKLLAKDVEDFARAVRPTIKRGWSESTGPAATHYHGP